MSSSARKQEKEEEEERRERAHVQALVWWEHGWRSMGGGARVGQYASARLGGAWVEEHGWASMGGRRRRSSLFGNIRAAAPVQWRAGAHHGRGFSGGAASFILVSALSSSVRQPRPPTMRKGKPKKMSAYVAMTVMILVDPSRMKLVPMAKTVPARKVSTVSCSGSTQLRPFSLMNGMIAS